MQPEMDTRFTHPHRARDFVVSMVVMLAILISLDVAHRVSQTSEQIDKSMHFQAKRAVFESPKKRDIVVVGSSVIGEGLNPDAVSARVKEVTGRTMTTFNFGTPAGSFIAAAFVADSIVQRPRNLRPSIFVVTVSPMEFSCCPQVETPSNVKYTPIIRLSDIVPMAMAAPTFDEKCAVVGLGLSRLMATRASVRRALLDFQGPDGPITFPENGGGGGFGAVDPATQDHHAKSRAASYRSFMMKPRTIDKEFTISYFRSIVHRLNAAGVEVAFVGGPQARQMDVLDGPDSIYPEYIETAEALGKELGIGFVNMRAFDGLENTDFVDGDHLNSGGAVKFAKALADRVVIPIVRRKLGADLVAPPAGSQ
jgi:hypothetical protein